MPVAIFPEFKKVLLPSKVHYLAHYLLWKSIQNKSCAFAFNQMRRVLIKYGRPTGRLYEALRIELSKLISSTNSGRPMSTENKQKYSARYKGTNCYRNIKTGEIKRFNIGESPDGWEPFQLGRVRKQNSKNKISVKMKNRKWQYNDLTREIRFEKELLPGFTPGWPEWYNRDSSYLKNLIWVHDTETKKNLRIDPNVMPVPDGFVIGRHFDQNKGFDLINKSNKIKVIDLKNKEYCLINKSQFPNKRYAKAGQEISKIVIYKFKNTCYTCYKDLLFDNPELPDLETRNINLLHKLIPLPHKNMTEKRQQFCTVNHGKTMEQIGLLIFSLTELDYDREIIYVRY